MGGLIQTHTLDNCLFAKQELIKQGFTEEDFYSADEDYLEIGYLIGEPMLKREIEIIPKEEIIPF